MTARVTTLKGDDAGAYYVDALPSYYLDADEPAGRWQGRGAAMLGLHGQVDDADFLDVMAGVHPRSGGATLGRAYGDTSVRGSDVTASASAPKSVSTLFAIGDAYIRDEVLSAHDSAVAAMVSWAEDHAHTRYRINGKISIVDAAGIIAATFRQHTSRALDPQLHTHVVIANRVRSPDGRWLALDARGIKMDQRTLSAIYHATLRAELTSNLGVAWRPVQNGIAEIDDIPDVVLEEFSARTGEIARRVDEKLDRFVDTFERDPTPRERWRLEREAVVDSRPAKAHDIDAAQLHRQWHQQVEGLGFDASRVLDDAIGTPRLHRPTNKTLVRAVDQSLRVLAESQSSWRPAELTRELAAALPADLTVDPADIPALLDTLTTEVIAKHCVDISRPVLEDAMLRKDGRPVTESVADRALTTPEILAQEERLLAWAERRMTHDPLDSADAPARSRIELSVPQAETAAAVAGDAHLVLVVGPAGTGKTTALRPAVEQLHAEGRAVFATDTLDRLAKLADDRAWRIALVGDPMQFSAVGRGGMYQHLIDTHGAIELDQVHRFTNNWERNASLRLRRGDPTVADLYDLEGRLHGGTAARMERQALDAWWAARHAGETVVLAAPTNDTVAWLNHAAQQRRVDAGQLDTRRRSVDAGGYRLFVGDEIATRRNHRQLHTDHGIMIRNRDRWTIDTIHRNGDLTVTGRTGTARLPTDYVQAHVELAYAQTSHATQGRTVDRSILLLDGLTDVRGVYVPMTRGRHHNDAYIVTSGEDTASDIFADAIGRSWIDQPALARQAELTGQNQHRPGTLAPHTLRTLLDQRAQLTATLDQLRTDLENLPGEYQRTRHQRDRAKVELDASVEQLQDAFDTIARYDKPLRRRGNEVKIGDAKHTIETLPDQIRDQAAKLDDLTGELDGIDRRWHGAEQLEPREPALESQLQTVTEHLDDDRNIRTRQIRRNPPGRITNTLGARPPGGRQAQAWDGAAGRLDQHQVAFGLKQGIGSAETRPSLGFAFSRALALQGRRNLEQSITHQHQRTVEIEGPGLRVR